MAQQSTTVNMLEEMKSVCGRNLCTFILALALTTSMNQWVYYS